MSIQSLETFMAKVEQDPELKQKLTDQADENGIPLAAVAKLAAEKGYEFSVEDISSELSEDQLDAVAGGLARTLARTTLTTTSLKGEVFPKVELYPALGGDLYLKWY